MEGFMDFLSPVRKVVTLQLKKNPSFCSGIECKKPFFAQIFFPFLFMSATVPPWVASTLILHLLPGRSGQGT